MEGWREGKKYDRERKREEIKRNQMTDKRTWDEEGRGGRRRKNRRTDGRRKTNPEDEKKERKKRQGS